MPRLFSALIALVVGYLDGAGLGAACYEFLARAGPDKEMHIALVAVLATGPLGALLAFFLAGTRSGERLAKSGE
jgi:hypothetical protein